jgi:hypothetical protein
MEHVESLAPLLRVSPETLTRWIYRGYQGLLLDGCPLGDVGWFTSKPALDRFVRQRPEVLRGQSLEVVLARLNRSEATDRERVSAH